MNLRDLPGAPPHATLHSHRAAIEGDRRLEHHDNPLEPQISLKTVTPCLTNSMIRSGVGVLPGGLPLTGRWMEAGIWENRAAAEGVEEEMRS